MSSKVNTTPQIGNPTTFSSISDIWAFLGKLVAGLISEFRVHAIRLNSAIVSDGTEAMTSPLVIAPYTVATVPDASLWSSGLIYVSNETGGAVIAFSDGTNWRRVTDRVIVS